MAKKATTKNRLERFREWSPSHRAAVLDAIGLNDSEFKGYDRSRRRTVLDRALNEYKNRDNPDYLTRPLTPQDARSEVNAGVNLKYGEAEKDARAMGGKVDAWYGDYLKTLQGAQANTQNFVTQMAGADVAVPQVTDPADVGQQAAANRAVLMNSMNSALKGQGAGMAALYGNQAANSDLAKIGWQQQAVADLTDLLKEKGSYATELGADIRDREHTKQLERAAYNLDQRKVDLDAAADANEILANGYTKEQWAGFDPKKRRRITLADKLAGKGSSKAAEGDNFGYTDKKWSKMSRKQKLNAKAEWERAGDKNGPTQGEKSNRRKNDNSWTVALNALRGDGGKSLSLIDLTVGYEIPADLAQAALYWRDNGAHLTTDLAQKLKTLGVKYTDDGFKGIK